MIVKAFWRLKWICRAQAGSNEVVIWVFLGNLVYWGYLNYGPIMKNGFYGCHFITVRGCEITERFSNRTGKLFSKCACSSPGRFDD